MGQTFGVSASLIKKGKARDVRNFFQHSPLGGRGGVWGPKIGSYHILKRRGNLHLHRGREFLGQKLCVCGETRDYF